MARVTIQTVNRWANDYAQQFYDYLPAVAERDPVRLHAATVDLMRFTIEREAAGRMDAPSMEEAVRRLAWLAQVAGQAEIASRQVLYMN